MIGTALFGIIFFPLLFGYIRGFNHVDPVADPDYYAFSPEDHYDN